MNEQIRVREVRLIDETGEQLGIVPIAEALRIAQAKGVDLIEVAPNTVPPVCRLQDYGQLKYEQTKKEREARRNQKVVLLKEVRLTPTTGEHDLETKSRQILEFLQQGDKVKITVRFKGREMAHPQLGRQILETIVRNLANAAGIERMPDIEGRMMTMIVAPTPAKAPQRSGESEPQPAVKSSV